MASKYIERHEEIVSDDGFLQKVREHVKIGLKYCPFCGGKAHHTHAYDEDRIEWQIIKCKSCGAQTELCEDLDEAVDAWNARV